MWTERPSWVPGQINSLDALRVWVQASYCRMLRGRPVEDLDLLADIADAFEYHETTYPLRRRVRQVTSAKATITTRGRAGVK